MLTWSSSYPTGHCFSASYPGSSSAYLLIYLHFLRTSSSTMMCVLCADVTEICISSPDLSSEHQSHIKRPIDPLHPTIAQAFQTYLLSQTLDLPPQFEPAAGFTTLVKGSFILSYSRQRSRCLCQCLNTHPHSILHSLLLHLPGSPFLCTWKPTTAFWLVSPHPLESAFQAM